MKIKQLRAKEALLRLIMEVEQVIADLRQNIHDVGANPHLTAKAGKSALKILQAEVRVNKIMLRDYKRAYGLMDGKTFSEAKSLDAFNELVMICEDIKSELGQNND